MAVIQSVAGGNFEALPSHFTEDIELHIHGFPPLDNSWHGCAEVIAAMAANFNRIIGQRTAIEGMIQQGDAIAVLVRETGRFRDERDSYRVHGVIWFTFREGRISRVMEFVHRAIPPHSANGDDC